MSPTRREQKLVIPCSLKNLCPRTEPTGHIACAKGISRQLAGRCVISQIAFMANGVSNDAGAAGGRLAPLGETPRAGVGRWPNLRGRRFRGVLRLSGISYVGDGAAGSARADPAL